MKKYKIKRKTIYANIVGLILVDLFYVLVTVCLLKFKQIDMSFFVGLQIFIHCAFDVFMFLVITDFKAYACVTEKGFIYKRYGRYVLLSWDAIQRAEYRVMIHNKKSGRLVIHSNLNPIFIDPSFENYLELWSSIVTKYSAVREAPCIDKELLDLVNMDKDME